MSDVGICQKGEVDLPTLLQKLKREIGGNAGAVGCFVGIVRSTSRDGKKVKYLRHEFSEEAVKELKRLAADIERLPSILKVVVQLIVGDLKPGEDAIYVLVAGERRTEVFSALPQIIDWVKANVQEKEITE